MTNAALEFLKEGRRMCKSYPDCKGCQLENSPCGFIRGIVGCSDSEVRCAIEVVEQWSKEHPIITNEMKFKEVFGQLKTSGPMFYAEEGWWNAPYKEPEHEG